MSANVVCLNQTFTQANISDKFHLAGSHVTVQVKLTAPSGPVAATVALWCTNTFREDDSWRIVGSETISSANALHLDMFEVMTSFAFARILVEDLTGTAVVSVSTAVNGKGAVQDVNLVGAVGGVNFTIGSANLGALGAPEDDTAATDSGNFSLISLIKRGLSRWTALLERMPFKGVAPSNASMPVVLASNDAQIGEKVTAATMWAGGSGILGWLSMIAGKLNQGNTLRASALSVTLAADDAHMQAVLAMLAARLPSTPGPQPVQTTVLLTDAIGPGPGNGVPNVAAIRTVSLWGQCDVGTGVAIVSYHGSMNNGLSWDADPIATLTIAIGVTPTSDSFTTNDRYDSIRATVVSISGNGARVSSAMGY